MEECGVGGVFDCSKKRPVSDTEASRGQEDASGGGVGGVGRWEESVKENWDQRVEYLREWIVPRCFRYVFVNLSPFFLSLAILRPLFLNLMHHQLILQ